MIFFHSTIISVFISLNSSLAIYLVEFSASSVIKFVLSPLKPWLTLIYIPSLISFFASISFSISLIFVLERGSKFNINTFIPYFFSIKSKFENILLVQSFFCVFNSFVMNITISESILFSFQIYLQNLATCSENFSQLLLLYLNNKSYTSVGKKQTYNWFDGSILSFKLLFELADDDLFLSTSIVLIMIIIFGYWAH